jgi:hypothetical protein
MTLLLVAGGLLVAASLLGKYLRGVVERHYPEVGE